MANENPDSFQCGAFEVARNPDVRQFVEKLNLLREAVDMNRLQPGVGYDVSRSTGGTTITIRQSGGSSAADPDHPFRIKTRSKDKKYEFFVVSGYVGTQAIRPDNQEKWVAFEAPAQIYLEATISSGSIQSCTVKADKPDAQIKLVEIVGGTQTKCRINLGNFIPTEQGKKDFRVVQNVKNNLSADLVCYEGYPAIYLKVL